MGVAQFYVWYSKNFGQFTKRIKKNEKVEVHIDNFIIDMNGLIHTAAQMIYKYGNYKTQKSLLKVGKRKKNLDRDVFQMVGKLIENLVDITCPKKRIILCIDGVAPKSKQKQQRERRYNNMKSSEDCDFDTSKITPGTIFMNNLSKYIDWFLRTKISYFDNWKNLEIIFSNEKVPGEGEQLVYKYIRETGNKTESYCIHGLDADILMLSFITDVENFYVLRDELYDRNIDYNFLHIGKARTSLTEKLNWESEKYNFNKKMAVKDFIYFCYMIGNDFLPHLPGIEIQIDGINIMIEIYKDVCSEHGHLLYNYIGDVKFKKDVLKKFFIKISELEYSMLQSKVNQSSKFFKDDILENSCQYVDGKFVLDLQKYKKSYYETNFKNDNEQSSEINIKKLCKEYLDGLQWVLSYYTKDVPCWSWKFPYYYAPFASDLIEFCDDYKFKKFENTQPSPPFIQLLSVLSPKSKDLIPDPINNLLNSNSPISQFYPLDFKIDLRGKKYEWQGINLLPIIDDELLIQQYENLKDSIHARDKKRNITGKIFKYYFNNETKLFKSYYGDFYSNCKTEFFEF